MVEMYHCPHEPMERFVRDACRALGTADDIAAAVAQHLVRANLSGHDSHGVIRIPWYAEQVEAGKLVPGNRPELLRETPAAALFDARSGFGHYSTRVALDWATERAKQMGIAVATQRNATHIGRLGEYAERGAAAGFITLVTYGSAGQGTGTVAPFHGRERFLGTNPWAMGIPAARRLPMLYDAATSVIAEGKIRVARDKGASLPPGAILDPDGNPSTSPATFYDGGVLLPVGGEIAGHKGFGFSLASAFVGGLALSAPAPSAGITTSRNTVISGVTLIAIDADAFGEGATYAERVADVLGDVGQVPPVAGVERVLAPGEPEEMSRQERTRMGIPLPAATWDALIALADRLAVAPPEGAAA